MREEATLQLALAVSIFIQLLLIFGFYERKKK